MTTQVYDAKLQDFAHSDTWRLDTWVFQRLHHLLGQAAVNAALDAQLRAPGTIFFLHLLGTDIAGHAFRPNSEQYRRNIHAVDQGLKETVAALENFFNDKQTAWLFTSDHGMTHRGSHGAGDRSETETPFILWGAGIQARAHHHLQQADLCPLMASLLSIPIPVNSVGRLPVDLLNVSEARRLAMVRWNMRQLYAQLLTQQANMQQTRWLLRRFGPVADGTLVALKQRFDQAALADSSAAAHDLGRQFMALCLEGTRYYHTYDRSTLLMTLMLAFGLWLTMVLGHMQSFLQPRKDAFNVGLLSPRGCLTLLLTAAGYLFARRAPISYYVYFGLPIALLWMDAGHIRRGINQLQALVPWLMVSRQHLASAMGALTMLELLILSFHWRSVLSVLWLLQALRVVWPASTWAKATPAGRCWLISCLVLAVFPCLTTEYGQMPCVVFLTTAVAVLGYLWARQIPGWRPACRHPIFATQLFMVTVAGLVAVQADLTLLQQGILSWYIFPVAWSLLLLSLLVPTWLWQVRCFLYEPQLLLCGCLAAFFTSYLLLTIAYEVRMSRRAAVCAIEYPQNTL